MKENLKDKVTNICGIILLISGSLLSVATAGVALPAVVITGATVGAAVSGSIIAYFTGKNPNGTPKAPEKIKDLNEGK